MLLFPILIISYPFSLYFVYSSLTKILYIFACQKNNNPFDIVTTYVVALTNKRIVLGTKRLLFGYFFTAITPDMFNDLKVENGLIWGKIIIDTIRPIRVIPLIFFYHLFRFMTFLAIFSVILASSTS